MSSNLTGIDIKTSNNSGLLDYEDYSDPDFALSSKTNLIGDPRLRVLYWIMAFVILFGNTYVIISISKLLYESKTRDSRKSQHIIVLNIAISDILMGIYMLMISIKGAEYSGIFMEFRREWKRSALCFFTGSLAAISRQNTSFLMVLTTSYRLFSIKKPYEFNAISKKVWLTLMFLCWLLSIVLAILPLSFQIRVLYYGHNSACLPEFYRTSRLVSYFTYTLLLTTINLCCFLCVAIGYILIYKVATKRPVQNEQTAKQESVLHRKITRIIVTNCLCAVPIFIMSYVSIGVDIPRIATVFTAAVLLPINSAINPFLYSPLPDKLANVIMNIKNTIQRSIQDVKSRRKSN